MEVCLFTPGLERDDKTLLTFDRNEREREYILMSIKIFSHLKDHEILMICVLKNLFINRILLEYGN